MLTELIAATQRSAEENGNGSGNGSVAELVDEQEEDEDEGTSSCSTRSPTPRSSSGRTPARRAATASPPDRVREDDRRGRSFLEGARHLGVLILTHRRLLVDQFRRDLTTEGYGDRPDRRDRGRQGATSRRPDHDPDVRWFRATRRRALAFAYQLVICDEAHTALGEKTSNAIRRFPEPLYIGMTATEQLIAKQVSDIFPASVDDLPLTDAARRGLIAPLRSLRVPPVGAINSVPIVGGDFERALAAALDHVALNQAAASLYRDRFGSTPEVIYAAGVDHAYNLAQEFRAAGLKTMAVSVGRRPRACRDAGGLRARRDQRAGQRPAPGRGLNSPRATVCVHLAPTASKRVYQQRIGRIMHPCAQGGRHRRRLRAEGATSERVVSLHSLLDSDFYREGARVTPAPRRRSARRARRRLSPPPGSSRSRRASHGGAVIQREWQRRPASWTTTNSASGRRSPVVESGSTSARVARKFAEGRAEEAALETFLSVCAAEGTPTAGCA